MTTAIGATTGASNLVSLEAHRDAQSLARETSAMARLQALARRNRPELQALAKQRKHRLRAASLSAWVWAGVALTLGALAGALASYTLVPIKQVQVERVVQETRYVLQSYAPGESGSAQSGSVAEQAGESASPAHAASAGLPGAGPTGAGSALLSPGPAAMPQGAPMALQQPVAAGQRTPEPSPGKTPQNAAKAAPSMAQTQAGAKPIAEPAPNAASVATAQSTASPGKEGSGAYEEPQLHSQSPSLPQQPSIPRSKVLASLSYKVLGVPVDGVLNLEVDGVIKSIRVGQQLPDGSTLTQALANTNEFVTSRAKP